MNGANNGPLDMKTALHQIVDTCVRSGVVEALPGMIGIYLDALEQKREQLKKDPVFALVDAMIGACSVKGGA